MEVKHYAGDVLARACRRLAPGARQGRQAHRESVPNPVAQNRRQVAIVRAALQSAGRHARCGGPFIFQTARVHAHAPELAGRRRPAPCRVRPGASRSQQRAAVQACWPRAARAAKHAPAGAKHKGHFCLLFLRRRAAGPPVAPS
ncbi:MAG: nuclease-related domain-containing protein [Ruthenibacterium sp.]